MTIDDFWKKYNRCPKCTSYREQGTLCDDCKWQDPYAESRGNILDKFYPTEACKETMNREIDEW